MAQGFSACGTKCLRRCGREEDKPVRCAIYTRVSTEHGLEQDFNSLDSQHDAAQAYIRSQAHAGWTLIRSRYADGGYSGGSTERQALQRLLADVSAQRVDVIVVYKVDRLTRSLADFAKLVELFDQHGVSFVSVTQQFNTTTSMGRLTLNVLLSFAQFEREVTSERIRDKIAASKRKGLWVGGMVPLGYESIAQRPLDPIRSLGLGRLPKMGVQVPRNALPVGAQFLRDQEIHPRAGRS
jgi:site-specific DNA recombinase